jgi:hypothetical protein
MKPMLDLLIMAVIAGGALYLFNMLPIDATIKRIATVLILILAIVWAIRWLIGYLG